MTTAAATTDRPAARLQICDERETAWRRLYSTESGVIKEIYELKMQASDIPLFVYVARCGPNLHFSGSHAKTSLGSGASLDRQAAHDAAIGEALERYCPTYVTEPTPLVLARRTELRESALDPSVLSLYSNAQYASPMFAFERFTEDTRLAWSVMQRLRDRQPIRVPVPFVYLSAHKRANIAEICAAISTGLACATDPALALLKGLYESVERDAFNIVWLNRLAMPRVDVSHAMDPRLRTLLGHFERARVTPHFVQLTLDIQIPIVLCVLHDATGGRPVLAVGAAANLDPVRAACKAAEESAHTRQWVGSMHATKRGKVYAADFRNVSDFEDHVWLFESPEMAAHAAFLYSGRPIVPLESLSNGSTGAPASDLDVARRRVEQAGFDVLHKDMTTPDVRECGLAVHRTYIPGLQNINGPHLWRLLGGRRLYELPVTLGLRQTPLTEAELNPIPHPFP